MYFYKQPEMSIWDFHKDEENDRLNEDLLEVTLESGAHIYMRITRPVQYEIVVDLLPDNLREVILSERRITFPRHLVLPFRTDMPYDENGYIGHDLFLWLENARIQLFCNPIVGIKAVTRKDAVVSDEVSFDMIIRLP